MRMTGLLVSMNKNLDVIMLGVVAELKTTTTEVEEAKKQDEAGIALPTFTPKQALHFWLSLMKLDPVIVKVLPA